MPVTPGMRGQASITVDQSHSAKASGSGTVPTLGTPALVALMERAAINAVRNVLEQGEESIGTMINLRQLVPIGMGKHVRAEAVVSGVEGNRVSFAVTAQDSRQKIAEGTHERVIVDREEFIWQTASRGV